MASGRISQMEDTEFMDSSLITVDPDGILPPDSLTSAEEYNPHCTTEVHMVVRDLSSGPVLRDDAYHHPRVTGSHRQFGESDSDIQEWVQSAMEACLSCKECDLCQSSCPSEETLEFWRCVDTTTYLSSRCHIKFYKALIECLKDLFPEEPGLKNTRTMNVLRRLLLGTDTIEETEKIHLQRLLHVVRFFGPVRRHGNRCVLIQQVHQLIQASLQYKDQTKREKISWFAGEMTRKGAEENLNNQKDFTFLIRMSQTNGANGDFALSVVKDGIIHHFEIKGQPDKALISEPYSACLLFNEQEYKDLPSLVDFLKFNTFSSEEDGVSLWCRFICPGLPFNALMSGYKKAGRS